MEQQHPIPQHISSYQFRLVGDMTLKQFFQIAGGALVALAFYASSLPAIFRWPGIILSFLLGVALAFLPLQDRPLETWIKLFVKAVYSPTLYTWQKATGKRQFFAAEATTQAPVVQAQVPTAPSPTLSDEPQHKDLDKKEEVFLASISSQLGPTPAVQPQVQERKVSISDQVPIKVEKQEVEYYESSPQQTSTPTVLTPSVAQKVPAAKQAVHSPEAAPLLPPTAANIVVGRVVDMNGKIIEGVILEIKDDQGRSTRALKTNKLGYFMIVTPLLDGKYTILTEKDGFGFDPVEFSANNTIIPPISIQAKGNE